MTRSDGTLVGVTAADGVVVVADTRSSRGSVVEGERARKIERVHPTAAMGSTGDLGAVQSFVRAVRSEADRYEARRDEPMAVAALGAYAGRELRSRPSVDAAFLLGGVDADGSHVFTLDPEGGVLEDAYAAVGSGKQLATGILDREHADPLPTAEARRIAVAAVRTAAGRDGRTGVGLHFAEITADGVEIHEYETADELPEDRS